MPLSGSSYQGTLQPLTPSDDRHHTGRYVAGGTVLVVTLLILHHVLLRDAPTIAGICIHTIIMISYILWVLYTARRDKLKARRMTSTRQRLTEVITSVPRDTSKVGSPEARRDTTLQGNTRMTSVVGRPVMLSSTKARDTVEVQDNFHQDLRSIT